MYTLDSYYHLLNSKQATPVDGHQLKLMGYIVGRLLAVASADVIPTACSAA
jgi:hypothetical protein